jgi:hypothetical protein
VSEYSGTRFGWGATCKIWRAFITPYGTVSVFFGRIGDIEIGRTKTLIRVNPMLDLLTVQMPRRLFQATCNHIFGGPMCGYDRINGLNASGVPSASPCGACRSPETTYPSGEGRWPIFHGLISR